VGLPAILARFCRQQQLYQTLTEPTEPTTDHISAPRLQNCVCCGPRCLRTIRHGHRLKFILKLLSNAPVTQRAPRPTHVIFHVHIKRTAVVHLSSNCCTDKLEQTEGGKRTAETSLVCMYRTTV
jgi:hypothetical protein